MTLSPTSAQQGRGQVMSRASPLTYRLGDQTTHGGTPSHEQQHQQRQPYPHHHHHHHHHHVHHARYRSSLPVPPPLQSLETAETTRAHTQPPHATPNQQTPLQHQGWQQQRHRDVEGPLSTTPVAAAPIQLREPQIAVTAVEGSLGVPIRETQHQQQQERGGRRRGQRRRGGRHRGGQHAGAATTGAASAAATAAQQVVVYSVADEVDLADAASPPATPPNQRIHAMVLATQDSYNLDQSRRAALHDGTRAAHAPTAHAPTVQGGGQKSTMATATIIAMQPQVYGSSSYGRIDEARSGCNPAPPSERQGQPLDPEREDSPKCWRAITSPSADAGWIALPTTTTTTTTSVTSGAAAAAAAAALAHAPDQLSRTFSDTDWKSPLVMGVNPSMSQRGVHAASCISSASPPTHAHYAPPRTPPHLGAARCSPAVASAAVSPMTMAAGAGAAGGVVRGWGSSSAGLSDVVEVGFTPASTPARAAYTPQQRWEQQPQPHHPPRDHFHVPSLSVTSLSAEDALYLYGQCSTPREAGLQTDGAHGQRAPASRRAARGGHTALVTPMTVCTTFEAHVSAAGVPTRVAAPSDFHDDVYTMPPSIASVSAATDAQDAARTRPLYCPAAASAAASHGSPRGQRSIAPEVDIVSEDDDSGGADVWTALQHATSSSVHLHYRRDADFLFSVDDAETSQEVTPVAATRANHNRHPRHDAEDDAAAWSRSADAEAHPNRSTGSMTASATGRFFMHAAAEAAIAAEAAAAAGAAAAATSAENAPPRYNGARSFSASSSAVSHTAASSLYCSPQQLRTGGEGMSPMMVHGLGSARHIASVQGRPPQPPQQPRQQQQQQQPSPDDFLSACVDSRGGWVAGTGYTPPRFEAASPYSAPASPFAASHCSAAGAGAGAAGGGEGWLSPLQWDPQQAREELEMEAARHVAHFALAQAAAAAAEEACCAAASTEDVESLASPLASILRRSAPPSPLSATASFRADALQPAAVYAAVRATSTLSTSCYASVAAQSYPSGATESTMDVSASMSTSVAHPQRRAEGEAAVVEDEEEDAEWLELLLHYRDRENECGRLRRLPAGPPSRAPTPTTTPAAATATVGGAAAATDAANASPPPPSSSSSTLSWWATSRLMRHGLPSTEDGSGTGSDGGAGGAHTEAETRAHQQQQQRPRSPEFASPPTQLCVGMSTHAAGPIISRQVRRHLWRLRERESHRVARSMTSRKPRTVVPTLVWAAA